MERMTGSLPVITFEALHDGVAAPTRATREAAGYDLAAYLRGRIVRMNVAGAMTDRTVGEDGALVLAPGEVALVPLGFRARLPDGFEAQIRIRSSAALKKGLTLPNAPGTIDADYPDEWLVMVRNSGGAPARIEHGERIAQVVLARYAVMEWRAGVVARSTDRVGGLGSTG
jgi:dUTP diphosphatase